MPSLFSAVVGLLSHGVISATLNGTASDQITPRNLRRAATVEEANQHRNTIVFGAEAPENRFPYTASLQNGWGGHQCGGSLISPDFVMTSAHCAYPIVEVLLGPLKDGDQTSFSERFGVEDKWIHPEYDFLTHENDLMLIKIRGNSTISPVMLNRNSKVPNKDAELSIVGWGRTNSTDPNSLSTSLQEARVLYSDNKKCQKEWGKVIQDDMLCTISNGWGVACNGDSGGPVVLRGLDAESDVQVGAMSWGPLNCELEELPNVSSRISEMTKWIDSVICDNSDFPTPEGVDCFETLAPTASPVELKAASARTRPQSKRYHGQYSFYQTYRFEHSETATGETTSETTNDNPGGGGSRTRGRRHHDRSHTTGW